MIVCKYFSAKELVSKTVYEKYGESIWGFVDNDIKIDLDTIREANGRGIIINNWHKGGNLSQCGLRANLDPLVKGKKQLYLSAHTMFKGFDLHDVNGDNNRLWNIVYKLIQDKKLLAFKRLENLKATPAWTHIDTYDTGKIVF